MLKEWPTQDRDMAIAEMVISKYIELNDSDSLGLYDVLVGDHEKVDIQVSDWVIEMGDIFASQYGAKIGDEITKRVVTKILVSGETIH